MWDAANSSEREIYSTKFYIKIDERSQINNLNSYFKKFGKEEQRNPNKNPKVSRKKEIIKSRSQ